MYNRDLGLTISGSRHNHPPPQALCNTSPHIQPSSEGSYETLDAGEKFIRIEPLDLSCRRTLDYN